MHQRHQYDFRVPFADVDHAGIVYYPRLFHYFHLAYEDFFHKAMGFPFQNWFEGSEAIIAPITKAEARFLHPLRHGDEVKVEAWIHRLRTGGWDWDFEACVGPELCVTGRVAHVFTAPGSMERVELPEAWRQRVQAWVANSQ